MMRVCLEPAIFFGMRWWQNNGAIVWDRFSDQHSSIFEFSDFPSSRLVFLPRLESSGCPTILFIERVRSYWYMLLQGHQREGIRKQPYPEFDHDLFFLTISTMSDAPVRMHTYTHTHTHIHTHTHTHIHTHTIYIYIYIYIYVWGCLCGARERKRFKKIIHIALFYVNMWWIFWK